MAKKYDWWIDDVMDYVSTNPDVDLSFIKNKRKFNNTHALRLAQESGGYLVDQLEGRRYADVGFSDAKKSMPPPQVNSIQVVEDIGLPAARAL